MMEVLTLTIRRKTSQATFATLDLTVFCRLDEFGLVAVGQGALHNS